MKNPMKNPTKNIMKKIMNSVTIALAVLALCATSALAVSREEAAAIAREATGGAEVARVELDDGVYEIDLRGEGARYRAEVLDATGALLKLEKVSDGDGRATSFTLTEAEARDAAATIAPEAANGLAMRAHGAQGSAYEVFYAGDGAVGEIAVNAQTGAILRETVYPEAAAQGVLSLGEVEARISERLRGAQLTELELDWDDGRYVYEGEASAKDARYSFELRATDGAILEFERED